MYKYSPLELRFIIVDPKFVDLEPFHNIPHMLFDTIIEDVKTTSAMLTWAVEEMDKRYRIISNARAKNLKEYNRKAKEKGEKIMPRLVIINSIRLCMVKLFLFRARSLLNTGKRGLKVLFMICMVVC
jgi:S-DNA-T family DNA segregation ATPase FtsK/SpoIIIE